MTDQPREETQRIRYRRCSACNFPIPVSDRAICEPCSNGQIATSHTSHLNWLANYILAGGFIPEVDND